MKSLLIIGILCSVSDLFAISEPASGRVLDHATKKPLPFANIVVLGKHKGSVSNIEGHFILDLDSISPLDTILFSYMGYETLKISAAELRRNNRIYLHRTTVQLKEVEVLYKALSAREIVARTHRNLKKNHPSSSAMQEAFFHKYARVPFPEENQITLLKSDFVGLDEATFDEVFRMMPREFIEYQDAIIELYNVGKEHKMVLRQGISLEEGNMQAMGRELENKLSALFEDIEKSREEEDVYYQFRSGIISQKMKKDSIQDMIWEEYKNDTLHYTVAIDDVKEPVLNLLEEYARPQSKNWEFIKDRSKYDYVKEEVTSYNNEPVYRISFTARNRGLFKGEMYISTSTYALLQLDFAFAEGKQSDRFQILGFGHLTTFRRGHVIFEQGETGYFVKYINAQQHEKATVDRKFSILKKEKRALMDKELNEIKFELQLDFEIESSWELLVLDREEIDAQQLAGIVQPPYLKFRKEYVYTPEMWEDRTVIVPVSQLKKYKRK